MSSGKNNITFHEEQQFRESWVWIIISIPTLILWYITIQQLIFGNPVGNNPGSDTMIFVFWVLFGILLPLFFYRLKLITEVRDEGLYVRFVPFHFSFVKISLDDLKKYYVRTYDPIGEYGGWGIRCGLFGHGKAYNVSGEEGVQLEYNNGKKLLIGSQKAQQLKSAIDLCVGK